VQWKNTPGGESGGTEGKENEKHQVWAGWKYKHITQNKKESSAKKNERKKEDGSSHPDQGRKKKTRFRKNAGKMIARRKPRRQKLVSPANKLGKQATTGKSKK